MLQIHALVMSLLKITTEKPTQDNVVEESNGSLQSSVNAVQDHIPVSPDELAGEPQKHTYASILRINKGPSMPFVASQPSYRNVSPSKWGHTPRSSSQQQQTPASATTLERSETDSVEELPATEDENEGCRQSNTLCADLGLQGFPTKDLHFRFLSQFTPVFYIQIREYSKTVAISPYVVNCNGAVLHQYPGPWQVIFKQADGSYMCITGSATRFTPGEAKEELLRVLGLQEEEGATEEDIQIATKDLGMKSCEEQHRNK